MILARYGEILNRLAYHMLQTSKCVDIIRVPQSNWGKSTLAELMDRALPGMIARTSLRVLSERSQFTPSAKYMATKRIVFFDEAGSDKTEISMTRWMELADRQHIEEKGKNAYDANRTATAVLIGQAWPALDTSVPGVEQRLQWAYSDDSQFQMTQAERELILSPSGVEFVRAYLVDTAHKHYVNGTTGVTPAGRKAVAEFVQAERNPFVAALRAILEQTGDDEDHVFNSDLKSKLADFEDVDLPSNQQFGRFIQQCFPLAKDLNRNSKRGYQGCDSNDR